MQPSASPDSPPTWLVEPTVFANITFDYLIIGGGTAGLALATRLSEYSIYKVGVVEAGPYLPNDPLINTPASCVNVREDMSKSWQITTTPQTFGNNRSVELPCGKVLGGSSAINMMAYLRGSKADYDNWEALGNPGWNWKNLLPYFKKSETAFAQRAQDIFPGVSPSDAKQMEELNKEYRGSDGPLKVTYNSVYNPLIHASVKALNALGIPTNIAPVCEYGTATGVFNTPRTVDQVTQKRCYAVPAYLEEVNGRDNIFIVTQAHATRVVLSEDTASGKLFATGVEFISHGETFLAHTSKEVIISAGALQTPKVLELSGIGDKGLLSSQGIRCLIDLPQVGENYQDHLGVTSLFELKPEADTEYVKNLILPPLLFRVSYISFSPTPPTDKTCTLSAFSFFPLKKIASESAITSMLEKLDRSFASSSSTPLQKAQFELYRSSVDSNIGTGEVIALGTLPILGQPYMALSVATQHPYSRGYVHIQSANPFVKPIADPHFLESSFGKSCVQKKKIQTESSGSFPLDIDVLCTLTRFVRTVAETEPLKSIVLGPVSPPPSVESEEDFRNFVKNTFKTYFHSIGTAAMAPRELGGVVDPSLLVYGTCNLRVVDASIIPLHVATHIQASVYAIAEKASGTIFLYDTLIDVFCRLRILLKLRDRTIGPRSAFAAITSYGQL
ncbi:GMC oxidoreductase-domain-containing protein [Hysterangium stoloniferum]|nr:GMC oxidoreductase-domain-containing protein [Hysterangium stoloniferum]